MTNPVPEDPDLSQAERIDQVCTAFEAAWKTGAAPRLEDVPISMAAVMRPPIIAPEGSTSELVVTASLPPQRV